MANLARRMTKRSRSGARSRAWHLVPEGRNPARPALCGTRPAFGTFDTNKKHASGPAGWSTIGGSEITCPRCIAAERRAVAA